MNTNFKNHFKLISLLFFLIALGYNNAFTQPLGTTAKDGVPPYEGPFHYGTNLGYYPGLTDGNLGDLAVGIGATTLRPALFEHFTQQYGNAVNIPWFQHYDNLGLKDNTLFVGYPSEEHRDQTYYCPTAQSTAFKNMYAPIWDGGANGTPVNDTNYYAVFLYEIVTLYKPYIKFWEVWNEPDLDFNPNGIGWRFPGDPMGSWWDNDPDPCDIQLAAPIYHYNRLLRISYEVIKSIDPEAYVTVGGLGYPSFLDAMMRNTDNPVDGSVTAEYPDSAGAYFDVLSFHSYPHINGSLVIWDPINGVTGHERNSDRAIKGITEDANDFRAVLANYGYDGLTYPKKEFIMTESSIPRKKFGDYIGSEKAALNYAIKLPIELQRDGVLHFHYYDLGEKADFNSAQWPFAVTGFYENLNNQSIATAVKTNQGIAYKTVSDLLFEKTYDPVRSAALNLPSNIDGGAFKDNNGQYTYALWSICTQDDNEVSSATYDFPQNSTFNFNSLESRSWDYSLTNQQAVVNAQGIALTGTPIFLTVSNQAISFTCPADISQNINGNQNGDVVTWTAPTATTLCPNSSVTTTQTGGPASGSVFPVGVTTVSYQFSDDCGNVKTCSFNIEIIQDIIPLTCPNGDHKVTINVIGNGSVQIEYMTPAGTIVNCPTGTCEYCVPSNTLLKITGLPNAGATFQGWTGGGCNGTNVCWKSISWETEITATFTGGSNPIVVTTTPTSLSCNGTNDGSVATSVSGGDGNYSYSWSNGQSTQNLNNLPTGNYVVTVSDSNGDVATATANVAEPTALIGLIVNQVDESCVGDNDGEASISTVGGTPPYTYNWSNSSSSTTITNLSPGNYTVTISDANSCTTTTTATIAASDSSEPVSNFSKTITLLDVNFSDISSGNPTTWLWEFGDGNTSTSNNPFHTYTTAGNYSVCLTVSNDCGDDTSCENISVGQTNNIDIDLTSVSGNTGTIVQVPVIVSKFNDVLSFQHSFMIADTSIAEFVGTSNFLTTQLGNAANIDVSATNINTIWLSTGAATNVQDGATIYLLDVLVKGDPSECVDIVMDTQNYPTEFVVIDNGNIVQVGYNFTQGEVCSNAGVILSGRIKTENDLEIEDVEVFNNAAANTFTMFTDANGLYEFAPAPSGSSFLIEPHKNVNHRNGVTSFDLAIIQQHIIGNISLDSPYKMIAADIDNSGAITSLDLWYAQQVIITTADTFPDNESWRFIPDDYIFSDPSNPFANTFPESITQSNVLVDMPNQNFVAVKVGDVNHTALPNTLTGGDSAFNREDKGDFDFFINKQKTGEQEFYLEFLAKDFKEMSAFQFDLFFEKDNLEFDRIEGNKIDVIHGSSLLENGVLTFIWYTPNTKGESFDDETGLFKIYFKQKTTATTSVESFRVVNEITPAIAFDFEGNPSVISLTDLQKIKNDKLNDSKITVYQNIPNPFSEHSKIIFKMGIDDLVQINFVDQHGSTIYSTENYYSAGTHQLEVDANDFPSAGIYYYSITTSSERVVRKMIIH